MPQNHIVLPAAGMIEFHPPSRQPMLIHQRDANSSAMACGRSVMGLLSALPPELERSVMRPSPIWLHVLQPLHHDRCRGIQASRQRQKTENQSAHVSRFKGRQPKHHTDVNDQCRNNTDSHCQMPPSRHLPPQTHLLGPRTPPAHD